MRNVFKLFLITLITASLSISCTQKFDFGHIEDAAWTLYGYRHIQTLPTETVTTDNPVKIGIVLDNSTSTQKIHDSLEAGVGPFLDGLRGKNVEVRVYTTSDFHRNTNNSARPSLQSLTYMWDPDGVFAYSDDQNPLRRNPMVSWYESMTYKPLQNRGGTRDVIHTIGPGLKLNQPSGWDSSSLAYDYRDQAFRFSTSMSNFDAVKNDLKFTILNMGELGHQTEQGLLTVGHILNARADLPVFGSAFKLFNDDDRGVLLIFSDEEDQTPIQKDDPDAPLVQATYEYPPAVQANYSIRLRHKVPVRAWIFQTQGYSDGLPSGFANIHEGGPGDVWSPLFYGKAYVSNPSASGIAPGVNTNVNGVPKASLSLGLRNDIEAATNVPNVGTRRADYMNNLVGQYSFLRYNEMGVGAEILVRIDADAAVDQCSVNGAGQVVLGTDLRSKLYSITALPFPSTMWFIADYMMVNNGANTIDDLYSIVGCEKVFSTYVDPAPTIATTLVEELDPDADNLIDAILAKQSKIFGDNHFFIGAAVQTTTPSGIPGSCGELGSKGQRYMDLVEKHTQKNPGMGITVDICNPQAYSGLLDQVGLFATRTTSLSENKVELKSLERAIALRIKRKDGKFYYPKLVDRIVSSGARIDGDQIFVHPSELKDGDVVEILVEKAIESSKK